MTYNLEKKNLLKETWITQSLKVFGCMLCVLIVDAHVWATERVGLLTNVDFFEKAFELESQFPR